MRTREVLRESRGRLHYAPRPGGDAIASNEATTRNAGVENHLARHGKVSYIEIPATDPERSAAFYQRVFGWTIRGYADRPGFADVPDGLIGHFVTDRKIAAEPGIALYIYVDGVDATIEKITANGGEVVRAPYREGDLWVATFRDPGGNVVGIWQAGGR